MPRPSFSRLKDLLPWTLRRRRLVIAAAAFLVVALAAFGVVLWAGPVPTAAPPGPGAPAVTLLTSDGEPFAQRGAWRGPPVDVTTLPTYVPQAFVAIEDRRFYRHHGVDLRGVARAAAVNLRAGGAVQGGSTITQQLIKNTDLGPEQTLGRKVREAIGAVRLERRLDKNEILSRYLSTIYFGQGAYGLGAAAHTYFDKSPEALSLSEAAMLAGLVKAPTQLSPGRRLAEAQGRQRVVLTAMAREGYIGEAEASTAVAAVPVKRAPATAFGGYFADWVYPAAARSLEPGYGAVTVRTTLDGALQKRAEAVVRAALDADGGRGQASQAALVAMRPDGAVVAMVGGRSHAASSFNRAVQAVRQPGSTFKLFVYLTALQQGASADHLVSDAPVEIGDWRPDNADHAHHGVMTFQEAFATSSNLAAVRVSQTVGIPAVVRTARDLGVTSQLEAVPSLALGSSGVSLLELTGAYAAVAQGAYPVHPTGWSRSYGQDAVEDMDPAVRQEMLRLLHAAADRVGPVAELPIQAFGKTGTSQNFRDALFVGFAGDLVVGVWVGNDDEQPMNRVYGSAMPARIWADFMRTALADQIEAARMTPPIVEPEPELEEEPRPEPFRRWWNSMRRMFAL